MPTHAHAIARMDRASDEVKLAFDELNSYQDYLRHTSNKEKVAMDKREELRGKVMKALGFSEEFAEEIAQDEQVKHTYGLLMEKECNLAQYNGTGVARRIQEVKEMRALVETTAEIVAKDLGVARKPKRGHDYATELRALFHARLLLR